VTPRPFRAAAVTLVALATLALAAPILAPRPPDEQEDVAGARLLPPLTAASAVPIDGERMRIVTGLRRTAAGWEAVRAGRVELLPSAAVQGEPSRRFYLLGTDSLGRDLASRLLFGLRHSAGIAALAVALALVLGLAVGGAAGLAGGIPDAVLMRGVDAVMSTPRLLLFLLAASLYRPSAALVIVVLGGTTWTGMARLARSRVMALRGGDLVRAARAAGVPTIRLWLRHLVPQIGPTIAVTAALLFADTLVLESAISFLGLGAPPPAVSLGGILASGRDALSEGWWVAAWPGLTIVAFVLSLRATAAGALRTGDPTSTA